MKKRNPSQSYLRIRRKITLQFIRGTAAAIGFLIRPFASADIATRRLLRGLALWNLPLAHHTLATQGVHDFIARYARFAMYVCIGFVVTRWLLSRWLGAVQGHPMIVLLIASKLCARRMQYN
jgi:hypothetical protein